MIYLASPYSHPDPEVMHSRFLVTEAVAANYLTQRLWAYSPIVHCHEMARRHRLPTDFGYWLDYNMHMLDLADRLYVLAIPGWRDSKGVQAEIEHWGLLGRGAPVFVDEHAVAISPD